MTSRLNDSCSGIPKLKYFLWLHYMEGPQNILADNLSRLHHLPTPSKITEGKRLIEPTTVSGDEDN
jgi:hypothetical protein